MLWLTALGLMARMPAALPDVPLPGRLKEVPQLVEFHRSVYCINISEIIPLFMGMPHAL